MLERHARGAQEPGTKPTTRVEAEEPIGVFLGFCISGLFREHTSHPTVIAQTACVYRRFGTVGIFPKPPVLPPVVLIQTKEGEVEREVRREVGREV